MSRSVSWGYNGIATYAPVKNFETSRKVSQSDQNEFVRLRRQGLSIREIASITRHKESNVLYHLSKLLSEHDRGLVRLECIRRAGPTCAKMDRNLEIVALRRSGRTLQWIADQFGIHKTTVQGILEKLLSVEENESLRRRSPRGLDCPKVAAGLKYYQAGLPAEWASVKAGLPRRALYRYIRKAGVSRGRPRSKFSRDTTFAMEVVS